MIILKAFGSIALLTFFGVLMINGKVTKFSSPTHNRAQSIRHVNNADTGKAEANYKNYCAGCHGEQMNAFVDRKWKHGNEKADLFKAIKHGYHDEGMPGFDSAFTDDEINELAAYITKGIENVKRYDFSNASVKSNIFKTESGTVKLDTIVKGIDVPWGMAFLPNGDMLVTERSGKFYRVTKNKSLQIISGTPEVFNEGQGGLMDVELHPDFKNNNLIYLSYSISKKNNDEVLSSTAIMRAVLKGNEIIQQKIIYEALPYEKTKYHYGCRLVFGKDGYLYFSIGDRGDQNKNPQDISNSLGKIHRIKDDGSIPADNPFINTPNAVASIYSYGHRNPQGLALNPQTGEMWSNEHGPRGGDEVNLIKKGANYGWPVISYGINYDATTFTNKIEIEGMEQPLLYWVPSIAPSGMAFVKGGRYKAWEGHALVGSLRFNYLNLCKIQDNKIVGEEILLKNIGRMRDVRVSPDGYIYVAVEKPGGIFRLIPVNN